MLKVCRWVRLKVRLAVSLYKTASRKWEGAGKMVRQKQADISFRAGMEKVVRFVNTNQQGLVMGQDLQIVAGNNCKYGSTSHLLLPFLAWRDFIEELGLETKRCG